MRLTTALTLCSFTLACEARPPVYEQQVASCDDEARKAEQMRSVSGHDDDTDVRRKADAVALSEYFLERCFPESFSASRGGGTSGTVGEAIDSQRALHNQKYPNNPI